MLTLVTIVLDGLVYASWLFMVSLGLTLIYGVMRILNIAHGSLYALGAYAAASLIGVYFAGGYWPLASFGLLIVAAIGVGFAFGLVIERGLLRFVYGRDEVILILVTYSVFLMLEDFMKLTWGVDPYFAFQPYGMLGIVDIAGLPYLVYDLALIVLAVLLGVLAWWSLNRTHAGKLLLAVTHDREMSTVCGIDVNAG
jgi:branched-chain amino acid transport system permease protein